MQTNSNRIKTRPVRFRNLRDRRKPITLRTHRQGGR
jgi:hypothetical protein